MGFEQTNCEKKGYLLASQLFESAYCPLSDLTAEVGIVRDIGGLEGWAQSPVLDCLKVFRKQIVTVPLKPPDSCL